MDATTLTVMQYIVPTVGAAVISGFFAIYTGHKTKRITEAADEAAKTTAQASVNDTFTRAFEAADKHWGRYAEQLQKSNDDHFSRNLELTAEIERVRADLNAEMTRNKQDAEKSRQALNDEIIKNAQRIDVSEMRAEAERVARTKAEHLYSVAVIYLRRVIRWINDNLPGSDYPAPPPEIDVDLDV